MNEDVFPFLQPETLELYQDLEVFKEVKWDFITDTPVYENGEPVFIYKEEALLVWSYNAIKTERFLYEIYSEGYGNEFYTLVGQVFSEDVKRTQAIKYIFECLLVNPYIKDVLDVDISFDKETLKVGFKIDTTYGVIEMGYLNV